MEKRIYLKLKEDIKGKSAALSHSRYLLCAFPSLFPIKQKPKIRDKRECLISFSCLEFWKVVGRRSRRRYRHWHACTLVFGHLLKMKCTNVPYHVKMDFDVFSRSHFICACIVYISRCSHSIRQSSFFK